MSFASAIVGAAKRMPLTDVITRAAIHRAVNAPGAQFDGRWFGDFDPNAKCSDGTLAHNRVTPEKAALIQRGSVV